MLWSVKEKTSYRLRCNQHIRHKRTFTLVEALLSVAIVAAGLIGIMQALMKEVSALSNIEERIESARILQEKFGEVTKELLKATQIAPVSRENEIVCGPRRYKMQLYVDQKSPIKYLYEIQLVCSWQKFAREQKNTLVTFLYKPIQSKNEQ
ncbi:MAG: hypothetical protein WCI77_02965 [Candidatus Omnitrophota bacterium]